MSQHDYDITNADANAGLTMRAAINAAFQALASNNSGSSDPSTTYPFEFKVDTSTSPALMKIRNSVNDEWVTWGYIDTTTDNLFVYNADKIKVSSNDTTPSYLNGKLVAGENVTLTEGNDAGNETLTIDINGVPIGTVISFAGSAVPSGYLHCNGTAINRTTYADLFAIIGTTYGVGNGSTTFNLPDYRGLFLRGYCGTGIDTTPSSADPEKATRTKADGTGSGDYVGSYQSHAYYTHGHVYSGNTGYQSANHIHSLNGYNAAYYGILGGGSTVATAIGGTQIATGTESTSHVHYFSGTTNSSGNTYESRPINRSVMFCIKY